MKQMYRFKLTWSLLIIPHLHLIYDFFSRLNLNLTFNKFCTLNGDDILIAFASLPRPSPTYHDRNNISHLALTWEIQQIFKPTWWSCIFYRKWTFAREFSNFKFCLKKIIEWVKWSRIFNEENLVQRKSWSELVKGLAVLACRIPSENRTEQNRSWLDAVKLDLPKMFAMCVMCIP